MLDVRIGIMIVNETKYQRRSQEFDFGGYKWVKETKQPHKKFKVDWFGGGIYTDIPPRRYAPAKYVGAVPTYDAAVRLKLTLTVMLTLTFYSLNKKWHTGYSCPEERLHQFCFFFLHSFVFELGNLRRQYGTDRHTDRRTDWRTYSVRTRPVLRPIMMAAQERIL